MPVVTRVEPIGKDIEAIIAADLSPAAQSRFFAEFARERIREGDDQNRRVLGRVPRRRTWVDGNEGTALESVRPRGHITAEWSLISDALRQIVEHLIKRSPRVSGAYQRAHTLFCDGREVPIGGEIPDDAEEYVLTNPIEYSRVIEMASRGGKPVRISLPHPYERTAQVAKRQFGAFLQIEFTYRGIIGATMYGRNRPARRGAHNKANVRWPAIVIKAK